MSGSSLNIQPPLASTKRRPSRNSKLQTPAFARKLRPGRPSFGESSSTRNQRAWHARVISVSSLDEFSAQMLPHSPKRGGSPFELVIFSRLILGASLELCVWFLVLIPSPPQFIRPTVPRPVNIGDFACFIRPNCRPKPSQIRPKSIPRAQVAGLQ